MEIAGWKAFGQRRNFGAVSKIIQEKLQCALRQPFKHRHLLSRLV
jgi:hypothetical protein